MKNLLLITFDFPPSGRSSTMRVLNFSKYLPEYNWRTVILTIKENYYDTFSIPTEMSLWEKVDKNLKIYRTRIISPFNLLIRIKNCFLKNKGKDNLKTKDIIEDTPEKEKNGRVIDKILFYISDILTLPDKYIGWLPFALFQGIKVIRKEKIDIIYSTAPPKTAHLIGYMLKKLTGKPWIADFRDPWTLSYAFAEKASWKGRRKIEEFMEREIVKYADKVISISDVLTQKLCAKYFNIEKEKFITITNGFDPDDFKGITLERLSEKFTMSYIGSFYRGRTPEYFLKALTELIEENQGIEKEISVIFLGEILEEEYKTLVNGFKWDKILKIINWLPHNEAIRYMSSSDVLLLFIQKQGNMTDYIVTGKIFEYLAAKKPILALVPSTGVAAEIIRKTNTGAVIEPDNPQEIKKAIIELYNKYKEKCLKFEGISAEIAKFSYERLGLNLTEILNSILSSKGNKNGE